ncbi:hypothetical protein H2279_08295 [Campylobacter sp. B0100352/1]|uniref:hypothetical protein n=1 Tax=Campylobacter sp. B0100352/1 TaxID=2735783 RepID=UPI001D4F17A8|nr:hypothetical protein [Campylobacter sp. B0100352/1]
MKFKIIENKNGEIFPQWNILLDLYIKSFLDIFCTHDKINKNDMIEIIEYTLLCDFLECSNYAELFMIFNLYTKDYQNEFLKVFEKLFINNMIDFYINDEEQYTLTHYMKEDKYQVWKYFMDNYIYKERFYVDSFLVASWDNPNSWDKYNINAIISPKGEKYFNEILAPKFYNKYKDLEVEIDDKGNIIRWIGEINR